MPLLLIALIVVPLAEIAVFIQVGGWIGLAPTLLTVILTAVLGAVLLRRQGLHTVQEAQAKLNRQEAPIRELFDGLCLFAAGALLLTPGFLTDVVGFALLVPPVRLWIARILWRRLMASPSLQGARAQGWHRGAPGAGPGATGPGGTGPGAGSGPGHAPGAGQRRNADAGPVIDADFEEIDPRDRRADPDDTADDSPDIPPRDRSRWGRSSTKDGSRD